MSLRRTLAIGLVVVSAPACGGAAPPAFPASAPPVAAAPPAPPRRGPSPALLAHASFDSDLELVVYADLGGFFKTTLVQSLARAILTTAQSALDPTQLACANDVMAGAREVLLAGKGPSTLILVGYDEAAAKPASCLALGSATPATIPGAPDGYRIPGGLVAHLPGLLVVGADESVAQALHQKAPGTTPAEITLADDQYLAWSVKADGVAAKGGLVMSADHFTLDFVGDLPEILARKLESEVATAKAATNLPLLPPDQATVVKSLLGAVRVKRDGKHVEAAFDLAEPVVDQARDLAAAGVMAVASVRKYITVSKVAEARGTVRQIARSYAAYWEREEKVAPGKLAKPKKLVSFGPVPKAIPKAEKYPSTAADWAPWAVLSFSMDAPQYFQYEVVAAKDGKSADVLARGDLNGNGKPSLFKLHLSVDPKTRALALAPAIDETDPEE